MPERRKAISRITERSLGGPFVWDGRTGTIEPGQSATTADWDEREAKVTELFDLAVDLIDWNRILIAATGRHLATHPSKVGTAAFAEFEDDPETGWPMRYQAVCGECVMHAILTDETAPDWPETDEAIEERRQRIAAHPLVTPEPRDPDELPY